MGDKLTSFFEARRRILVCIIGIAIVYDLGMLGLQLFQWFGLPQPDFVIDEYSTPFASALCAAATLLILQATRRRLRALAWALGAILALLVVDNTFSIHARMDSDDYLAVLLWLIAGAALFILLRSEKPSRIATAAICSGFLIHGLAALTDGADGGILTFGMISPFDLDLTQVAFELAYIGLYVVGLVMLARRSADVAARATPVTAVPAAVEDKELLELESWYWAWRSQAAMDGTDAGKHRTTHESLVVVDRMVGARTHSIAGVAAKLRVLRDMMQRRDPARGDIEFEIRLLDAAADDAGRLAERGADLAH